MHPKSILAVTAIASLILVGCRERAASTADAAGSTEQVRQEQVAASPSEATASPMDASLLAAASWTRHACSLDMVDRGPPDASLAKGTRHSFEGYVLDQSGQPAGAFSLVLKGAQTLAFPVTTGKSRPDVAEYFKNPSLASAGFEFSNTLASVPAGKYAVWYLIDRDSEKFFCDTGKSIDVK